MIIDQYRAHVRILYEQYMSQFQTQKNSSQKVLFPEVVHISPSQSVLFQHVLPEMEHLGFEMTDLGSSSYAVNAVPAGMDGINPIRLVEDMVQSAMTGEGTLSNDIHHSLALSMARHAAIPHGQVLGNEEMENLVNRLFACANVNYTPDGKSILCILQQQEIERLLG